MPYLLITVVLLMSVMSPPTQQPRQLKKREAIQERALAALASQQSESGHDCANATTTYDENMCLSKVSDQTQEAFDVFYKDLFSLLGDDDRTKLGNAQAQWIHYRKFSCDAVGEMFRGGTIRRSREMRCKIALTRSRMRDLADLYDLTLHN
jgi:uncharacterized protein YecT (DUF1311 family)